MTELHFRAAAPGEEDRLTELCVRSKAHWGYDADFLDKTREDMTVQPSAVQEGWVLVAEAQESGEIVGVSAVNDLGDGLFEIDLFFLAPEVIGQGLGRPLFEATAALAREAGGRRLKIVSDPNAAAFYERMGAVPSGEEPSGYIKGRTLPLLYCDL